MNFSSKIKKFCDGMIVYDHLLEDEGAIHIPFALSFYVTITTIVGQLKQFLIDLKNHVCHEIPDINIHQMDVDKIMSPKFKWDMKGFGNITMRELLEKLFGPLLDKTPLEFFYAIRDNVVQMVQHVVEIRKVLDDSKPELFGQYICRRIREGNYDDVKEEYHKGKKNHCEITMEMLQEKQEQVLKRYLDKGIMRFAKRPTKMKMQIVDYDFHIAHQDYDLEDVKEYKMAYTQMMDYATRNEEMLCVNYNKYGKYVFTNYDKFSEGQKPALLELCVILDLIHKDMVELKPELGKYLGITNDEGIEGTRYFAIYINLLKMFEEPWFKEFRSDKKYNMEWIKRFLDDLLRSEWRDAIADEWQKPEKRLSLRCAIIGALKDVGVIKGSYRAISMSINLKDEQIDTLAKYMGYGKNLPFFEWIDSYVKG